MSDCPSPGSVPRVMDSYARSIRRFVSSFQPLREGPQPADWVHDRWLPGEWEIQLPGGWSIFPDAAQKQLEKCFQQQAREATLQVRKEPSFLRLSQSAILHFF